LTKGDGIWEKQCGRRKHEETTAIQPPDPLCILVERIVAGQTS